MKSVVTILAIIFATVASSQTQIAGKVTDQKGAPIPGANIFIEGTFDGTTTDVNGDFSFSTTAIGNQKLVVSMMAFETLKIQMVVANFAVGQIKMKESIDTIDAVVITAGTFEAGDKARVSVLKPLDIVTTAGSAGNIIADWRSQLGLTNSFSTGRLCPPPIGSFSLASCGRSAAIKKPINSIICNCNLSLSLQLLLENTVKHNVVSEQKPLQIRIYLERDYLCIQNDFHPKEVMQDRQGVGLQNIISRYGIITNRKVLIEQTAETFTVKIPILTKKIIVAAEIDSSRTSYEKAQKRVEDIKGFYGNLGSYIIVIVALAIINLITYRQYLWFLYPTIGWGIGVLMHWMSVFNRMPFVSKEWEEQKIRTLMEKEKLKHWK